MVGWLVLVKPQTVDLNFMTWKLSTLQTAPWMNSVISRLCMTY